MPVALGVFAKAAKDAGLSVNGTTKELFKLMEQGKVSAEKILPHVARGFSAIGEKNGALEKSLARLSVKMGQARYDLQTFQGALFEAGGENGVKILLKGFAELMEGSKYIAKFFGGIFEGAIFGFTAPLRLLNAAIQEVFSHFSGAEASEQRAFTDRIIDGTAAIVGMVAGVALLVKGLKLLFKTRKLVSGSLDMARNFAGGGGGGNTSSSSGSGWNRSMGKRVFVTNMGQGGMGGAPTSSTTGGNNTSRDSRVTRTVKGVAMMASIPLIQEFQSIAKGLTEDTLKAVLGESVGSGVTFAMQTLIPSAFGAPDMKALFQGGGLEDKVKSTTRPTASPYMQGGNNSNSGSQYQKPPELVIKVTSDSELFNAKVEEGATEVVQRFNDIR